MPHVDSPTAPVPLRSTRIAMQIPYPNPVWARLLSLVTALVLSGVVLAAPQLIAVSAKDVAHGLLTLTMWGIAAGFVHGVGFVPRHGLWRLVFHPAAAWLCMGGGAIALWLRA